MDWNSVRTRVILPRWIWKEAKDKEHFKHLVSQYMKRYPGYKVLKLGKYYAICERNPTLTMQSNGLEPGDHYKG